MSGRLSGKVCIITGTGGSIGREAALAFARDLAVRTFGRIDVLFNNAAMAYFNWLEDISDEEWNRDLREDARLTGAHDRQGGDHRHDAAIGDGGARAWDS